jgi:hypothetical protein
MTSVQTESPSLDKRFATEGELEAEYGIPRSTLQKRRFFRQGPRYYKFGRRVLYDRSEVEEFIRRNAVNPGSEER